MRPLMQMGQGPGRGVLGPGPPRSSLDCRRRVAAPLRRCRLSPTPCEASSESARNRRSLRRHRGGLCATNARRLGEALAGAKGEVKEKRRRAKDCLARRSVSERLLDSAKSDRHQVVLRTDRRIPREMRQQPRHETLAVVSTCSEPPLWTTPHTGCSRSCSTVSQHASSSNSQQGAANLPSENAVESGVESFGQKNFLRERKINKLPVRVVLLVVLAAAVPQSGAKECRIDWQFEPAV
uniref:Uncharacterized protein n=1 Tax=Macrostomum lignano TaxID=282301 RepID=A0A1I8FPZ2_9PLAT